MTDEPELTAPDADGGDDDLSVSALEEPVDARRHPPVAPGRETLRLLWRASGMVAFITLIAIVVVALVPHLPRSAQTRISPPYIALQASSNTARCLVGASWSHDGGQIAAVLSYACRAPYLGAGPPLRNLFLYDASNGQEVGSFDLDSAISMALSQAGLASSGSVIYAVDYFATTWSPDDHLLAVQFAVYGEKIADIGVALVTLTGTTRGQVSVMLGTPNPNSAQASGYGLLPVERSDLWLRSHSTIFLAPALAYSWLPSDALVADEPLTTGGGAFVTPDGKGPLGDPVGGQTFSLWRTGDLMLVNATTCDANGTSAQPLPTPYAELSLSSVVWSPDGRYLLDVSVSSRLPVRAAGPKTLQSGPEPCVSGPAPDQIPSAPMHDKGLASALELLDPYGGNYLRLVWSPDGRRLAVATLASAQDIGSVVVYDCASGMALQRFTGDEFAAPKTIGETTRDPVWSPDGRNLLLTINGPTAKLVILGPQALDG